MPLIPIRSQICGYMK